MKYVKSAAVVAGSVVALGAAAPAFAAQPGASATRTGAPRTSLNGGLTDALRNKQLDGHQFTPLVKSVKKTGEKVKSTSANKLLGGVSEAARSTPLLGGLPIK
ncbi:hypothetical protein AB0C96_15600 [Streptomyces sp. NPDC048506]|uniref:hypothetical protein n=1 Tax=Streptomyces sp. NPDC048506 TaxID=3155028 RepID=UPI003420DDE0